MCPQELHANCSNALPNRLCYRELKYERTRWSTWSTASTSPQFSAGGTTCLVFLSNLLTLQRSCSSTYRTVDWGNGRWQQYPGKTPGRLGRTFGKKSRVEGRKLTWLVNWRYGEVKSYLSQGMGLSAHYSLKWERWMTLYVQTMLTIVLRTKVLQQDLRTITRYTIIGIMLRGHW